jgi:putative transcriptional regulator
MCCENKDMKSLAGHFLIADPRLADPNFRQSVVLIVRHDAEGALGLVVNRPAPLPFHKVWEQLCKEPCPTEVELFVGGPCGGPLMALHASSELGEIDVTEELHFTADIQHIRSLLEESVQPLRLFGGYSGWGPGQLESEMDAGGWLVVPADMEHIFGPPDELWISLMQELKKSPSLSEVLKIKNIPPEPWMN